MIALKCPNCGLRWNVREDTPAVVTCPMCLAAAPKPPPVIVPMMPGEPPPLLPLDFQTNRDIRAGSAGVWILLALIGAGIVGIFLTGLPAKSAWAIVVLGFLAIAGAMALLVTLAGLPGAGPRRAGIAQTVISICVAIFLIMGGCVALLFGACAMMLGGL